MVGYVPFDSNLNNFLVAYAKDVRAFAFLTLLLVALYCQYTPVHSCFIASILTPVQLGLLAFLFCLAIHSLVCVWNHSSRYATLIGKVAIAPCYH